MFCRAVGRLFRDAPPPPSLCLFSCFVFRLSTCAAKVAKINMAGGIVVAVKAMPRHREDLGCQVRSSRREKSIRSDGASAVKCRFQNQLICPFKFHILSTRLIWKRLYFSACYSNCGFTRSRKKQDKFLDREIALLRECHCHPNVVSCYGYMKTTNRMLIVMPMVATDLGAMIKVR